MFNDVWDTGPFGSYGVPIENAPDSGAPFNWQTTINRALDILGARYGEGGYISPNDPRYGQPGYPGSVGYTPTTQVGGAGGFSLSPMTWVLIAVGAYLILKKK